MDNKLDYFVDIEYFGNIGSFDCGYPNFNKYLRREYDDIVRDDKAVVHYIINEKDNSLIAYFSLLATGVHINNVDEELMRIIPAIEMTMFAIDESYQGKNLSRSFLELVHDTVADYSRYVGAEIILVHSVPKRKVEQVYLNGGFVILPSEVSTRLGCTPMYKII